MAMHGFGRSNTAVYRIEIENQKLFHIRIGGRTRWMLDLLLQVKNRGGAHQKTSPARRSFPMCSSCAKREC